MFNEKYMDLTINPGTDFFKYATGHWVDYNKPKPEYSKWGVWSVLNETNLKRINKIITNPDGSVIGQKINDFYNLCLDWERRDKEGISPVLKYLSENIYPLTAREDIFTWCAKMHHMPFFHIFIAEDQKNSVMNTVYICQSGLSLGNKDYYLSNDPANKKIIRAFKKYCISLYMAFGKTRDEAIAKYKTIMRIEKLMAKRYFSVEEKRDPELTYHKKSVDKLSKKYGYDFDKALKTYGFDNTDIVIVKEEKPVKFGCKLMNELSIDDLKTILEWQLIDYSANKLSDDIAKIAFKFSKVISGVKKRMAKKKIAINATGNVFGDAIGQIYVRKYFDKRAKDDVIHMIDCLKESFKEIISEKEWLSDETKEKAYAKLAGISAKIGYPSKIEDYSDCPIDNKKSYFENWIDINEYFFNKDKEKNYNKPVDKDEWFMYPHTINAYYNPTSNEICFPAGILQKPFYDFKQPAAINYGMIGAIIGHEMTHGYDNHGRQFDINGNHNVWWKDDEIKKFNELTENTKNHFNSLEVLPGLNCNGSLTLGENLADFGGLKIAYNAYKKFENKPVGWEKDFFLAYANAWAGITNELQIREQTMNDPHSIGFMRVNGTLPMFDAWYDAFGITEKDEMYVKPENRAMIW